MEENKHKKSKALIITIIVIILLLIFGYLIYKNRDAFGVKTSATIAKIFSPLSPSDNSKKVIAEAGEDLKNGDGISVSGSNENNVPIVIKANNSNYGFTNQDIAFGELGEVTINGGNPNTFWGSFSSFLGSLIKKDTTNTNKCKNGATNYPTCTTNADNLCVNGSSNPPMCTTIGSSCINYAINPPMCTIGSGGECINGADNPPTCTTVGSSCINGSSNPPMCTTIGGSCINNATNPPVCTTSSSGECINGASNPPMCSTTSSSGECINGASNPPMCTIIDNSCINGTDNPPLCTTVIGSCINDATNPPQCTTNINGECTNGADNPPMCTTVAGGCINGKTNPPECTNTGDFNFPIVTVTANPALIAKGESSTISWTSTNATTCDAGSGNGTGTQGSFSTGALTKGKSYAITCTGTKGKGSGNAFVSVEGGINEFPIVTVTANPSSIASGESSIISWTSTNTTTCDAGSGNGTGTQGSFSTEILTSNKMYSVTCTGTSGTGSGNAFVSVSGDISDGYPDLTTGTITPTSTTTKTATSVSSIIYNNGGGSTGKSFSAFFTITDANNQSTESIATVPKLEARSQGLATITHTFPQVGKYSIRACVDKNSSLDAGTITELNNEGTGEDNNCGLWTTLTVTDSIPIEGNSCSDGTVDYPNCKVLPDGTCKNLAINPPTCTTMSCPGGQNNPPLCTTFAAVPNACLDIEKNPLTFTDAEKAQLADLLRKFYLIAPTLKTTDDISLVYSDITQQSNFSDQLTGLINECYSEGIDRNGNVNPNYTGPTTRFGNPWYQYNLRGSYLDTPELASGIPLVTDSKTGATTTNTCFESTNSSIAQRCAFLNSTPPPPGDIPPSWCEIVRNPGYVDYTGCLWMDLREYELLLNVW